MYYFYQQLSVFEPNWTPAIVTGANLALRYYLGFRSQDTVTLNGFHEAERIDLIFLYQYPLSV